MGPKVALAALLASGVLAGQPALADTTPVRGGTLITTLGADPPGLNPALSTALGDSITGCMLYASLLTVTKSGEPKPYLAKSYTVSPDGLTYTFELNKAEWSDGKPLTSEDVKYSLTEVNAKYGSHYSAVARNLETIETPAPDKVIFKLKSPIAYLPLSLACGGGGAILPAHIFRGTNVLQNPANTQTPVGSGPFMLKEWKRGDHIRMVRNPKYFEPDKPYLDEIVLRIMPQAGSRTRALMAGELDYLFFYYLPASDHVQIESDAKLKLVNSTMPPVLDIMSFNVIRKPLDDKRVRQAMMMATDRDYLVKNAWSGKGKVGTMPFTSELPWAVNPDVDYRKIYPFDYAKANALLDQAGYPRGANGIRFKLKMVYATEEAELALAAIAAKSMWRNVGVDLEVFGEDRAAQLQKVFKDHDFDVTLNGCGTFFDPALGLERLYIKSTIGNYYGNASSFVNPEIETLLHDAGSATARSERTKLYQIAQAKIVDELPVVTLREKGNFNAASKKVHWDETLSDQWRNWADFWMEK